MNVKCDNCQKFCKSVTDYELETTDYSEAESHKYKLQIGDCCDHLFSPSESVETGSMKCMFCEEFTDSLEGVWIEVDNKVCPACFRDTYSPSILSQVDYYGYID